MPVDIAQLQADVTHLAAIERPSASTGERHAAEWIAARLAGLGISARVEEERAHGTYWWPLGLLNAIAALGGAASLRAGPRRRGVRALAVLGGIFGAAGVWDDVGVHRHWFRRALLPYRSTWNVVGEAGDPQASEVLVLSAHHDAAHAGLIFAPGTAERIERRFPKLWARVDSSPPLLYLVFGGPALIALGALLGRRRPLQLGLALAGGSMAAFADVGLRSVVPGANDNLSAVAALLHVAAALQREPVRGLRVLLVSTGSEESFEEGMKGFAARHFPDLPRSSTRLLVLELVGSPHLTMAEAEGMLVKQDYDAAFKDLVADCAREQGIALWRGLKLSFASDALVGLRHGYRTVMIGSLNRAKVPENYHWPTDVPENVDFATVADAARLAEAVVRRLAADPSPAPLAP